MARAAELSSRARLAAGARLERPPLGTETRSIARTITPFRLSSNHLRHERHRPTRAKDWSDLRSKHSVESTLFIFDTPQCSSPGRCGLSARDRMTRRLVPALEFARTLERLFRAWRTARGAHAALVLPETGDCHQSCERFVHNECHPESRLLRRTFSVDPC